MNISFALIFAFAVLTSYSPLMLPVESAPIDHREGKTLAYYDYLNPSDYNYDIPSSNDFMSFINDENAAAIDDDLSRTIPPNARTKPPANNRFNSPIYYIRLPPQPYMFVPGLGYVSQQQPPPMSQLLNLPVSFVTNGKPSTIYQWTAGVNESPFSAPTKPVRKPDSTVHKLPGSYTFNGKPEDIFMLRDSYNSLYGDALQNFYP